MPEYLANHLVLIAGTDLTEHQKISPKNESLNKLRKKQLMEIQNCMDSYAYPQTVFAMFSHKLKLTKLYLIIISCLL